MGERRRRKRGVQREDRARWTKGGRQVRKERGGDLERKREERKQGGREGSISREGRDWRGKSEDGGGKETFSSV